MKLFLYIAYLDGTLDYKGELNVVDRMLNFELRSKMYAFPWMKLRLPGNPGVCPIKRRLTLSGEIIMCQPAFHEVCHLSLVKVITYISTYKQHQHWYCSVLETYKGLTFYLSPV